MTLNSALSTQHSALFLRLLLAAVLMFGLEVLLWLADLPGRDIGEWLLLIPGYLALAALALDLLARYRVHDVFGMMVVAGLVALSAALCLNPAAALADDVGRTLITRVMGAYSLLALEMMGLFLALTGGHSPRLRRLLLIGSVAVGLAWGIWVRWFPSLNDAPFSDVPLLTMLFYGVGGLLIIELLRRLALGFSGDSTPNDMILSRAGFGLAIMVLAGLFIVQTVRGLADFGALLVSLLLMAVCYIILWFRRRDRARIILDIHIPSYSPNLLTLLLSGGAFLLAGVVAYSLPLFQIDEVNQMSLVAIGFTAYGLVWLPTVSLVIGVRTYLHQVSTRQM